MKKTILLLTILSAVLIIFSCNSAKNKGQKAQAKTRTFVDTIGYAHKAWQMDSVIERINNTQSKLLQNALKSAKVDSNTQWKVAISPHDDYTYVGYLYPAVLKNIKASTVILFGVTHHKAHVSAMENKIIFDDYKFWKEPYGNVTVSPIREEIMKNLPKDIYSVNDSMQAKEHSIEAIIPFIQQHNRNIKIVPILVTRMPYQKMIEIAGFLSKAIHKVAVKHNWEWGKDYAFVISTDAVHYGDQDWGTSELNFYGSDSAGYQKAVAHEHEIINNCLTCNISTEKIQTFINYTTDKDNYKKGKWSWCGRYSVPMGLLTTYDLQEILNIKLKGVLLGYATSLDHSHLSVSDLKMGITAPANIHHWVGYAAVGYK